MNIIRILFFAFLCILSSCNSDENLKIRQNLLLEELKSGILVCNDYRAKTIDWEFDRYRNKERKDFVLSASFSLDSVYNHFISKFNLTIKNEKLSESQWLSLHKIMVENTEANLKVIERAHIIHGTDADKRFFDEISNALKYSRDIEFYKKNIFDLDVKEQQVFINKLKLKMKIMQAEYGVYISNLTATKCCFNIQQPSLFLSKSFALKNEKTNIDLLFGVKKPLLNLKCAVNGGTFKNIWGSVVHSFTPSKTGLQTLTIRASFINPLSNKTEEFKKDLTYLVKSPK
jgi:hypothetical protein